ncbi:PEP-CTERM sorting domain-containing protein [Candidatus Auribacterota bacterium]
MAKTAEATIIYTDIEDVYLDTNGENYAADLNNDATPEIKFRHFNNYDFAYNTWDNSVVAYVGAYSYLFASALNAGITPTQFAYDSDKFYMFYGNARSDGQWVDVQDKYFAIKFDISGNDHYGWVRLDVGSKAAGHNITIKDYAYQDTPDTFIEMGATSGGGEVPEPSTLGVLALGALGVLYWKRRKKKEEIDLY